MRNYKNVMQKYLMGLASKQRNILVCLAALDDILGRMNAPIQRGVAVAAAQQVLAS